MDQKKFSYDSLYEKKPHLKNNKSYNVYISSMPKDRKSVPFHWHNAAELIVVKKGEVQIAVVLDQKKEKRICREGDFVLVPPRYVHGFYQSADHETEYETIFFTLDTLLPWQEDSTTDLLNDFFSKNHSVDDLFYTRNNTLGYHNAWRIIADIDYHCEKKGEIHSLAVRGNILNLCSVFMGDDDCPWADQQLQNVFFYVKEHLNEKIAVKDAAFLAGFVPSYFEKYFLKITKTTFHKWLTVYRLEKAKRMLKSSSNMKIGEIASTVGNWEQSAFCRHFRNAYHMTPSEYRNSYKSLQV